LDGRFRDGRQGPPRAASHRRTGCRQLDLVTVLLHTTSLRGNRWELNIPKPFLKPGAFHLQQVQTISTVKLERRLGVLTTEEMDRVRNALKNRLGI
jgi:mRNA-degrading endonuclease toxin of MazEF toxin-antitoxin module